MTWRDIILGLISWCVGGEIVNAAFAAFRMAFARHEPNDLFHLEAGGGLAVLVLTLGIWVRLKENAGDDVKAD